MCALLFWFSLFASLAA
uniref:Uncharacterized protein n=1 Tax=Rhizophora mucronata TaxID=61149 RepID=A0A2P2NVJ0_RHIMU